MTKKFPLLISLLLASASLPVAAAPDVKSVLDIKYSITNDDIVPPESFETKTRELEENFYLKNFIDNDYDDSAPQTGTPEEYEDLLSRLPVEIEMPYNSIVGKFIDMYLGRRRRLVSDMLALHNYYGPIFKDALAKEGLPMELQYLPVIESAINPNARSRAGAEGLWQFMPSTATGLGMEVNSLVDQRRDPVISSKQAARYFKQLYDIYSDWSLAIAAYNCGPGRVNQALRRAGGGKKDFWEIYRFLPSETRDYVPAFIAANFVMNYYKRYGIRPTIVKRPLATDYVTVNARVHFKQIADVLNIPIEEIRMLNPQFKKDIIPGNNHPYSLVLPLQKCQSYLISEEQIKAYEAEDYALRTHVEPGEPRYPQSTADDSNESVENGSEADKSVDGNIVRVTHIVARGENIRDIAKKYGVSATDIKHWNKLRRGKVKEGDELVIERVERSTSSVANVSSRSRKSKAQATVPMPDERKYSSRDDVTAKQDGKKRYSSTRQTVASKSNTDRNRSKASRNSYKAKKAAKPKVHTVAKGESLEKIARKTGVSVEQIRKANGMKKNENLIRVGQKLKLPSGAKSTSSKYGKSGKSKKSSASSKKSRRKSRR